MFRLDGRVALITGAGAGLGRSFANALAGQGATVLCADIDADAAEETAGAICKTGRKGIAVCVDVADEPSVEQLAQNIRQHTPRLDILINNAGVASLPQRLLDVPVTEWDRVNAINLRGLFLCTRASLPLLLVSSAASVINLSSYLGLVGAYPGFPVTAIQYGTTKAGVIGFTRQLAVEYAAEGLRANAIAPGWHFGTNLGKARRAVATADELAQFESFAHSSIPMRRFGTPEDLSGLVIYLASDASRYVTGQVFTQDGGITAA
ncbi:MAG: SDR family NAD(P)-dependent oxidoreductase [Xanthobacteraceae bacterium]